MSNFPFFKSQRKSQFYIHMFISVLQRSCYTSWEFGSKFWCQKFFCWIYLFKTNISLFTLPTYFFDLLFIILIYLLSSHCLMLLKFPIILFHFLSKIFRAHKANQQIVEVTPVTITKWSKTFSVQRSDFKSYFDYYLYAYSFIFNYLFMILLFSHLSFCLQWKKSMINEYRFFQGLF